MVATIRRTVWNEILPFNPEEVGVDSQKEDNLRRQFWDVMIDKLLKLRDLEDNWDENGARAPSKEVVDSEIHLAILLRDKKIREPNGIVPGVNGTVIFDWQGTDRSYLEIEITEPFHAECLFIVPNKPTKQWTINNHDLGIAA